MCCTEYSVHKLVIFNSYIIVFYVQRLRFVTVRMNLLFQFLTIFCLILGCLVREIVFSYLLINIVEKYSELFYNICLDNLFIALFKCSGIKFILFLPFL